MIYDCFNLFNELDLLELRLEMLYDIVDRFVITECNVTFTGKSKHLYYPANNRRYARFADKIIYQSIEDVPMDYVNLSLEMGKDDMHSKVIDRIIKMNHFPKQHTPYGIDTYGKECVIRALTNCNDNDIVMYSDLDEIPNPPVIKKIFENFDQDKIYNLRQKMYYYYMNCEKDEIWNGGWIMSYKKFMEIPVCEQKVLRHGVYIENGGWHFGYLGGIECIKEKLDTCNEPSINIPIVLEHLEDSVINCPTCGHDLYGRPAHFKYVSLSEMPEFVQNNLFQYAEYLHKES